jgi:hypothetical protein
MLVSGEAGVKFPLAIVHNLPIAWVCKLTGKPALLKITDRESEAHHIH